MELESQKMEVGDFDIRGAGEFRGYTVRHNQCRDKPALTLRQAQGRFVAALIPRNYPQTVPAPGHSATLDSHK